MRSWLLMSALVFSRLPSILIGTMDPREQGIFESNGRASGSRLASSPRNPFSLPWPDLSPR